MKIFKRKFAQSAISRLQRASHLYRNILFTTFKPKHKQIKVYEETIKDKDLEVVDLKDGLWVGKVVFLQVGIEASSRRAEVRDAGRCMGMGGGGGGGLVKC